MTSHWPWTELDIEPVNDERAVKRAYAKKLKALDPEADPAGFIELRSAYDYALSLAKYGNAVYDADEDTWEDKGPAEGAASLSFPEPAILGSTPELSGPVAADSDYSAGDFQGNGLHDDDLHDDEPYRYQPPALAADYGANGPDIAAALAELTALHQGSDPKRIDEKAVKAAFENVVASPNLENIIIAGRLENDLAMIVNNAGNKGFFLAELTDFHFGWTGRAEQFGLQWPMQQAQQAAQASYFFRYIDQGSPRSERERLHIQAYGWFEHGPSNWFTDIGRRKRVKEFLETLQSKAPSVYYALDQDKIDAWENREGKVSEITWPMLNFMLFSAMPMAASLGADRSDFWALTLVWALSTCILLAALLFRKPHVIAVPYFTDPSPVPKREWLAIGAMLSLIPLSLLCPPTVWSSLLFAAAAGGALAMTTHPNLPKSDGFWDMLAQRRYVICAFWIALHGGLNPGAVQFLVPTAIAAWAFTHAHPRFQASLDDWSNTTPIFRRWKLHAGILAMSVGLIGFILAMSDMSNADALFSVPPPLIAAAIILLLVHDAITGRYIAVAGMQFYLLRVVAGFALLLMPVLASLALVALRTLGILYVAFHDARSARASGAEWRDRGDGFDGSSSGFSWAWIGIAIFMFTVARILLQAT